MSQEKAFRERRELLDAEIGTIYRDAPVRVALVYPSPYSLAMASLGYQVVYRILNEIPGVCCERAMISSFDTPEPFTTLESEWPVGEAAVIALSVATEAELPLAAQALIAAKVPPLEADRREDRGRWPLVIAGGPLTYADGTPLAALADVVIHGEAEDSLETLGGWLARAEDVEGLLERCVELPGAVVPSRDDAERLPEFVLAADRWLPASAVITTPRTEFGEMFLVEPARGCPHCCSFCVMEPRSYRTVDAETVLAAIPDHARRVGLVGAALGHHRQLRTIIRSIVDSGRGVSLSSLRADRLDEEMVELLVRGGSKTLTVAADGASLRLRQAVRKRVSAEDLLRATELGRAAGLRAVKLYAMIGLPDEEEADLVELCELTREMSRILPVSVALSPFVPKVRTSLASAEQPPLPVLRKRLAFIRGRLRGRADLRATSVREAWIENLVARSGFRAGVAAVDVARAGGGYAAWKRAAKQHGLLK